MKYLQTPRGTQADEAWRSTAKIRLTPCPRVAVARVRRVATGGVRAHPSVRHPFIEVAAPTELER